MKAGKTILIVSAAFVFTAAVVFLILLKAGKYEPLRGVRAVSAGSMHTCAILSDGRVACWGLNTSGQLGDLQAAESRIPVIVKGVSDAVSISAGGWHTCAALKNGTVACWGLNNAGQLGSGKQGDFKAPVPVEGIADATSVSSGWSHSCALSKDGSVRCWGDDSSGQLGAGGATEKCKGEAFEFSCSTKPLGVQGIADVKSLSAGGNHTCAVVKDGALMCWGSNDHGELGLHTNKGPEICKNGGISTACSTKPAPVLNVKQAGSAAAGGYHTCYLDPDGTAACWGPNRMGQLAREGGKGSFSPVKAKIENKAVELCTGLMHNCVIDTKGRVTCWGGNTSAQLGVPVSKTPAKGKVASKSDSPVRADGVKNAVSLTCGSDHTCAALADGTAWCWGGNGYGKLGTGSSNTIGAPAPVRDLNAEK